MSLSWEVRIHLPRYPMLYPQSKLNDNTFDSLSLEVNDIDAYHGTFTEDENAEIRINRGAIKYYKVDGLALEINTVECSNLSPDTFLANNDLNVTASCFYVNFTADELFTIRASPQFWTLLFQSKDNRKIEPIDTFNAAEKYDATTAIRMAFKAYQMKWLSFSLGNIDPTKGTIAASQKEKFDKMKDWVDSPFHEYQCNKCRTYFVVAKKHQKVACTVCSTERANTKCSYNACKGCCVKHVSGGSDVSACKVKDHAQAAKAKELEMDVEEDESETSVDEDESEMNVDEVESDNAE